MAATFVVEMEVTVQPLVSLTATLIVGQIDLFILHRPPKSFDVNIVESPSFAVHADSDLLAQQQTREVIAGELAALVRIENLGLAVFV